MHARDFRSSRCARSGAGAALASASGASRCRSAIRPAATRTSRSCSTPPSTRPPARRSAPTSWPRGWTDAPAPARRIAHQRRIASRPAAGAARAGTTRPRDPRRARDVPLHRAGLARFLERRSLVRGRVRRQVALVRALGLSLGLLPRRPALRARPGHSASSPSTRRASWSTAVRQKGIANLSPEQAARMPPKVDTDSAEHLAFFKASFGDGDALHGGMTDEAWKGMLAAQATWDAAMAWNAVQALEGGGRPERHHGGARRIGPRRLRPWHRAAGARLVRRSPSPASSPCRWPTTRDRPAPSARRTPTSCGACRASRRAPGPRSACPPALPTADAGRSSTSKTTAPRPRRPQGQRRPRANRRRRHRLSRGDEPPDGVLQLGRRAARDDHAGGDQQLRRSTVALCAACPTRLSAHPHRRTRRVALRRLHARRVVAPARRAVDDADRGRPVRDEGRQRAGDAGGSRADLPAAHAAAEHVLRGHAGAAHGHAPLPRQPRSQAAVRARHRRQRRRRQEHRLARPADAAVAADRSPAGGSGHHRRVPLSRTPCSRSAGSCTARAFRKATTCGARWSS